MSDDSSDDCDDMLRQAVDPSLFTNSMFQETSKDQKKSADKVVAKSNRKLQETAVHKDDIEVSASMQNYVAKKLSSLIDNEVEFVETKAVPSKPSHDDEEDNVIRLFSNSVAPVKVSAEAADPAPVPKKIKKSTAEKKVRDPSPDDSQKFSEAAVDPSYILDQVEVKSWHKNPKKVHKNVDYYNLRNGQMFPVDAPTEFSALKKKNNWDVKKIREPIKRKVQE